MRGDISRVVRISTAVRDRLSHDALAYSAASLPDAIAPGAARKASASEQLAALDAVLAHASFSGQSMDSMTRNKGWRFLDIGRRLERVADLSDLIRHALVKPHEDEGARLQTLLEIADRAMTYRSRYVFAPEPAPPCSTCCWPMKAIRIRWRSSYRPFISTPAGCATNPIRTRKNNASSTRSFRRCG